MKHFKPFGMSSESGENFSAPVPSPVPPVPAIGYVPPVPEDPDDTDGELAVMMLGEDPDAADSVLLKMASGGTMHDVVGVKEEEPDPEGPVSEVSEDVKDRLTVSGQIEAVDDSPEVVGPDFSTVDGVVAFAFSKLKYNPRTVVIGRATHSLVLNRAVETKEDVLEAINLNMNISEGARRLLGDRHLLFTDDEPLIYEVPPSGERGLVESLELLFMFVGKDEKVNIAMETSAPLVLRVLARSKGIVANTVARNPHCPSDLLVELVPRIDKPEILAGLFDVHSLEEIPEVALQQILGKLFSSGGASHKALALRISEYEGTDSISLYAIGNTYHSDRDVAFAILAHPNLNSDLALFIASATDNDEVHTEAESVLFRLKAESEQAEAQTGLLELANRYGLEAKSKS
jgi:hypothetical protein